MTNAQIKFLETDPAMISAETILRAAASDVYALIADPARHTELDGGGSVRGLISGDTPELREGDNFTEKMFLGIPYRMSPTVVRAEKNQALSWRMPADHYWIWEIADNHDGTVTVRETWDASEAKIFGFIPAAPVFRAIGAFARNRRNIALSLAKLHRTFEG